MLTLKRNYMSCIYRWYPRYLILLCAAIRNVDLENLGNSPVTGGGVIGVSTCISGIHEHPESSNRHSHDDNQSFGYTIETKFGSIKLICFKDIVQLRSLYKSLELGSTGITQSDLQTFLKKTTFPPVQELNLWRCTSINGSFTYDLDFQYICQTLTIITISNTSVTNDNLALLWELSAEPNILYSLYILYIILALWIISTPCVFSSFPNNTAPMHCSTHYQSLCSCKEPRFGWYYHRLWYNKAQVVAIPPRVRQGPAYST